ncbi:tetraspanin-6 isoform X2 [Zeugodacus cucurbitae]|uniref:tetraspanin-6 isoform X2 n=1 Tax=Zeugodacus cucurbitae TaxID=28588 RepID=UPI0023D907F2|nr:tetraspanin-6 isoform X2 [Zeugodacus cucurbitae]
MWPPSSYLPNSPRLRSAAFSTNSTFNWYSMGATDQQTDIMLSFNFIRGMLLLFNLLLWFAGLLIILTGIWLQTDFQNYLKISGGYSIYVPYLLLIVGGILVFAASLACSCTVKVDPAMLVIYGGFLIAAMFTLILMSIYIYAYKDNVITALPAGIEREVNNYGASKDDVFRVNNVTLIDYVQNNLECCGSKNHLDWPKDSLPNSCCWDRGENKNCTDYQLGQLHEVGCLPKLIRLINTNLTSVGVMLSVLALFPLFAMVFSYSLASASRRIGYQRIG